MIHLTKEARLDSALRDFLEIPSREAIPVTMNEQIVVELYSK